MVRTMRGGNRSTRPHGNGESDAEIRNGVRGGESYPGTYDDEKPWPNPPARWPSAQRMGPLPQVRWSMVALSGNAILGLRALLPRWCEPRVVPRPKLRGRSASSSVPDRQGEPGGLRGVQARPAEPQKFRVCGGLLRSPPRPRNGLPERMSSQRCASKPQQFVVGPTSKQAGMRGAIP